MANPKRRRVGKKRGPKEETLILPGDWRDAVAQALKKKPKRQRTKKPKKG